MQCRNKHASDEGTLRCSQRVESVRKDVECTFGILKKRWRVLKNPMLLQSKVSIDNIVFTCAILHNMLLDNEECKDKIDNYHDNVMDPRVGYGPVDSSYVGEEI